ncbi:DUF3068 domain-containing protein [Streptomyces sp. TRM66268-LWL]|uniref:DUF3068 domain-containing protein n=1 Tax=Streptomyces polyasparticus TaxID=2767826 RepID=A0ABR7S9A6_9ACTN|nr:DUF3068 domain-containing protein [Streptomyces polyasparticus]MBC9712066.1 DUF3068 domain-containing protein [Streptomyces polyasparticus]
MRRKASLILLGFAVFFAALSPLIRFYAFPRLAKVPANQYQIMVLEAKGASIYQVGKGVVKTDLSIVQTLKGNVEESEKIEETAGKDVVVWDGLSYAQDSDGNMVTKIPERYIFDAHSAEPVHATGEMADKQPVKREGLEFKWPFLTEKRDYKYFDARSRSTNTIFFKGEQNFRGLDVYYFEQTIPWRKVDWPSTMPGGMEISPEVLKNSKTEMWYTTVRKFWVDPTTGAPVYGEEIHKEEMRGGSLLVAMAPGKDKLTVFDGHVKMREDFIKSTVDLVKSQRQLVLAMTTYIPWGFGFLALLLLSLSLWLEARSRRPDGPEPSGDREPEPEPAGV